jgi:hypothetical protein
VNKGFHGHAAGDRIAAPIWPVPDRRWTRFALGLPVNGYWHSDADWLAWGTKPIGRRPPRDLLGLRLGYRPGYQRMALRWSLTAGLTHETACALLHPLAAELNGVAAVAGVAGAYGYRAWLRHGQDATEPARNALQLQLSKLLDVTAPDASVARDGTVSVVLPPSFVLQEGSAKALTDIVQRTMGEELDVSWPNLLKSRTVTFSKIPEPPAHVRYDAIAERLAALPAGTLFLGVDARGRDVTVNLDTETPHIGLSMSTGRGKSVLFRLLIAQLLAQGADITILDVGMISLHEFRALDGVTLETDVSACWEHVTLFEQEMGERLRQLVAVDEEEWPAIMATWRRRVLFIEELNAFHAQSQAYWDQIRTSKDRATPPVLNQLTNISVMARKVLMHLAVASQRLEAKLISAAARGQMGLRILANPTAADWKLLGEGKRPRASYSRRAGRVAAVIAGEATALQVGYLERREAKEYVATHRSVLADVVPSYLATNQGTTQDVSYDIAESMTLRDYAEKHGESLTALQRAVQRASLPSLGVGAGGAKLYKPDDLRLLRANTSEYESYDNSQVIADVD